MSGLAGGEDAVVGQPPVAGEAVLVLARLGHAVVRTQQVFFDVKLGLLNVVAAGRVNFYSYHSTQIRICDKSNSSFI